MDNQVKTVRISTSIVGTILGETVTINYDVLSGQPITVMTSYCNVGAAASPSPTPSPMGSTTSINIRYDNGQKNVSVNGKTPMEELTDLIVAMEAEMDAILAAQ